MSFENSLKALNTEFPTANYTYVRSLTSSVTTSWGVDWNEEFVARDIMQNFFDANRAHLTQVRVAVEGTKATISAPAGFNL